jgi:hypothetical protein
MNNRFNLLRIINQQPSTKFANKIMRKRMQDARDFAVRIREQREKNWPFRGNVDNMDDYR